MKIPFVIDNIHITLAEVLNALLEAQPHQQVDIATAYFSIRGYQQLQHRLRTVGGMRLLLGDSPAEGLDVGLRPDSAGYLRSELNAEPLSQATQRLVEDLVRILPVHKTLLEPGRSGRFAGAISPDRNRSQEFHVTTCTWSVTNISARDT